MGRIAVSLRLPAGQIGAYERAHRRVSPEVRQVIKRAGIEQYATFGRGVGFFYE